MLRLSGFELYSRWVPLKDQLQNRPSSQSCIFILEYCFCLVFEDFSKCGVFFSWNKLNEI